jgi:ketosteroid isomerase-like protein
MTEHPNVELTRRGYDAFAKGDLATLSELIAEDAAWHVLGVGPLSGTYHGRNEIFGFFGRLAEETGGTPLRCACCRLRAGTSRSEFRWPTSAISAMAR